MLLTEDWGLIDYGQALEKQIDLVEKVCREDLPGVLVFCTHPPVVTLGRGTQPGDVFDWPGAVKEISRGGRATYHGPSQLVFYPIINLNHQVPARDIGFFLRKMESAIVKTLKDFGIQSQGKSLQKKRDSENLTEETGVWVGRKKVASLGIGVRKWITYHGAAINIENDHQAFRGMKPCGFDGSIMTNVEELLNRKINRFEFQAKLTHHFMNSPFNMVASPLTQTTPS